MNTLRRSYFHKRLRQARLLRKMSQTELMFESGISQGQISRFEANKIGATRATIHILAAALAVNPAWLIGETEDNAPVIR